MLRALVFVSERCPYCIYFKKVIEKLKRRLPDIAFEFIDVGKNPELARRFEVEMLPTTILLKGDEVIGGIMGYVDEKTALKSITKQIEKFKMS